MNHPSYWMYKERVSAYLGGNKGIFPRPARAMFEALGRDARVSFLEEIGSQPLIGENDQKRMWIPLTPLRN